MSARTSCSPSSPRGEKLELEFNPRARWSERIRGRRNPRGRHPLPSFYTKTGVGTLIAEGKEVKEVDGDREIKSWKRGMCSKDFGERRRLLRDEEIQCMGKTEYIDSGTNTAEDIEIRMKWRHDLQGTRKYGGTRC